MSILGQLFDERIISVFTAALTVAAYAFAVKALLLRARERRKQRQQELHNALAQGLSSGALESVEDLVNIYKGIHELGADDISYRAGLGRALREYLVKLVSDNALAPEDIKKLKTNVNAVLKQIEAESPFVDLPAAERNLIIDVQRFMEAGNSDAAKGKLQDLAGLVEVRQDALERLQASNKWSIPLAAIGLVLTIVFGVISLVK